MKTRSLLPALLLAAALVRPGVLPAETLAWWRLSEEQPPQIATEGGPDLKWWNGSKDPYVSEATAAPAGLYRIPLKPPGRSFSAGASYLDAVGGLISLTPGDFSDISAGLTVEGFFKTSRKKSQLENQAVVTCGEGWMDASWTVRLVDGRITFAIFQDNDKNPVAQAEGGDDLRDDAWHFFVARAIPSAPGQPARLEVLVVSESGASSVSGVDIPEGVAIRKNLKPLIVGRSSLYIDNKPEYCGTWDTFQGQISDIRISRGSLKDADLLGLTKR